MTKKASVNHFCHYVLISLLSSAEQLMETDYTDVPA